MTAGMLINVIFSPEKLLGLAHCRVQFDPPVEVSDSDAVIRKAAIQKPGPDSLDGVMTRGKFFSYLCRSPVVSIIWRVGVSDVIDILVNGMNVRLGESEAKSNDRHGMVSVRMRPVGRNMIALLVKKPRQKRSLGQH